MQIFYRNIANLEDFIFGKSFFFFKRIREFADYQVNSAKRVFIIRTGICIIHRFGLKLHICKDQIEVVVDFFHEKFVKNECKLQNVF